MDRYFYADLKKLANEMNSWIDVQDRATKRGRETQNTNKRERVSRALSWYQRSEDSDIDDENLIYSFIAFNALYSQNNIEDKAARQEFWKKLQNSEKKHYLFEQASKIEEVIKNILSLWYLSFSYWNDTGGYAEKSKKLQKEADNAKNITRGQIRRQDVTPLRLSVDRIHLLRNQVLHGMAAYKDSYNRTQVKICAGFLHSLTGRLIRIVIEDDKQFWGKVSYPPQVTPDEKYLNVDELND